MSAQKKQLKMYSPMFDEDTDLGLPSTDVDALLELGDMMATGRPNLIVHLQKWVNDGDT